ncbi:MAG: hypothetical protein J6B97_09910 [Bacteroidales bacterium]|nr:hypothetical protein [Bacteroidales bacterium]MBO5570515.1 hypothetical protein [Clostridia bacterium]
MQRTIEFVVMVFPSGREEWFIGNEDKVKRMITQALKQGAKIVRREKKLFEATDEQFVTVAREVKLLEREEYDV